MAYSSIHTNYGLARLAQAEADGIALNLTHIALGDGNGQPAPPDKGKTELVRERHRAAVNRVYRSPNDPLRWTAEIVIPASIGGFTLREVGIYDDQGSLFVVGDLPDTYKPAAADGAFSDTVLRIEFAVSNANVITLIADPNLVTATHTWVMNTINVPFLLPGGTTGQVLAKQSNADGDTQWVDPTVANVVVDVIEERQVLAAAQTHVTWSTVTTRGLAVYVEGLRLAKGPAAHEWQEFADDYDTTIVLGQAYPAATEIFGVQNDPAGSVSFPLIRDQNLADVPDKALGRQNLGVMSRAESRQLAPPGLVGHFAMLTAPSGWLKATGAAVSRTAYADLFAAIGTLYGEGDGFTTFNLPDLRGEFLRGLDDGRGVDAGRSIGSAQGSQNAAHTHTGSAEAGGSHTHGYVDTDTFYTEITGLLPGKGYTDRTSPMNTSSAGHHSHVVTIASSGGSEARPRNVAVLACIKY